MRLKVQLRFHFKKHKKLQKKCEVNDAFDVAVDGPLDRTIKDASVNLKFGSLRVLMSYSKQDKQNC